MRCVYVRVCAFVCVYVRVCARAWDWHTENISAIMYLVKHGSREELMFICATAMTTSERLSTSEPD